MRLSLLLLVACHTSSAIPPDGSTGDDASDAVIDGTTATGRCDQPLSGVPVPNAPHGIFALEFPTRSGAPPVVPDVILNNPAVCGGNVYIVWSLVDQGGGNYDFSSIDAQIATWAGAGRSVNLIVWAMTDGTTNTGTPPYVISQIETTSCAASTLVPLFWKEPYPTLYKAFIAEVLGRYGKNPAIGYIRFGLSKGGETFEICHTELVAAGLTDDLWKGYLTEMLQAEVAAAPTAQLMLGVNSYGNPPHDDIPDWEAAEAVSLHLGFGSQGLQASDLTNYPTKACSVDWCNLFDMYTGQQPLELQGLAPSQPDGTGEGSLVDLLPFAMARHTQIIEMFNSDLQIAYDPTNADYAQYGAGYRAAFQAVVDVVGGR